ncbi:MAG: hypothetical protein H7249_10405 [Chitinophagaceae bacterium]|nr:hypothetical protein [Oligoflexus sp.]
MRLPNAFQVIRLFPVRVLVLGLSLYGCSGSPKFAEGGVNIGSVAPGADSRRGIQSSSSGATSVPTDDHTPEDKGETSQDAATLMKWTFDASVFHEGSLVYTGADKITTQTLVTDDDQVLVEQTFNQLNRPVYTEVFPQSSQLQDLSESFQQNSTASGILDLLLVIDNSGSMTEEQQNLSSKLSPLLYYLKDSDWRIGVVTTDPKDGCLRGLISKGDANSSELFTNAVNAGIKGSGNERGILQAVAGLKGECNPSGS